MAYHSVVRQSYPHNLHRAVNDFLADIDGANHPYDDFADMTNPDIREDALSVLTDRHREILRNRYEEHLTLNEIGELMGITGNRVRQLEHCAFGKIRRRIIHNYKQAN